MSKKANPAAIGAFVVAALVIAAVALAILGSGNLFKQTRSYVLFFDSSLSGLDVGAPVEHRGVRIGSVTRIQLQYDTDKGEMRTPVYIEFEPDRVDFTDPTRQGKGFDYHIQHGMRAQLQAQSLITGKLKIMLVVSPESEIRLVGGDPTTPEMPTIPMLSESIAATIEKLPLLEIVHNLDKTMENLAAISASDDVTNAAARANLVLLEVQSLTSNLNTHLPAVMQSAQKNADQFVTLQRDLSATLQEVRQVMSLNSPERQQTMATMQSLEEAAVALRDLLSYLQLHPESLITGKKED